VVCLHDEGENVASRALSRSQNRSLVTPFLRSKIYAQPVVPLFRIPKNRVTHNIHSRET